MQQVLTDLQNSGTEWAFGKPVDSNVVVDYYGVITHPMGGNDYAEDVTPR